MAHQRLALEDFSKLGSSLTEISSVALGGKVISVSDEFFAEAFHLLLVEPALSLQGQYGPNGALYSGWETRRHNPTHDWCIIKLGTPGTIFGIDIDTSHFNGNEAPQALVQALFSVTGPDPANNDDRWVEILPKVDLGPASRHLFAIPRPQKAFSHVKLNVYPDGGIARFRVYGLVTPVFPHIESSFDLASVYSGGQAVLVSDQHYGVGSNLLLPGRGKDMSDGWETRRSREPGHKDWVIVKLGALGNLEAAEIDTANFVGNYPESAELHATLSEKDIPGASEEAWVLILPRIKLGPHRMHHFQLQNVEGVVYSHVRLTIHPDGGVKRLRITGKRVPGGPEIDSRMVTAPDVTPEHSLTHEEVVKVVPKELGISPKVIPALPLTPEAFAPYGHVVQAYTTPNAAPRGIRVTPANQGSAMKYHALAPVKSSYPLDTEAKTALSMYRCKPIDAKVGEMFDVKLLERHPCTNQAFFAVGGTGVSEYALTKQGRAYLVIVASNGEDDKPDMSSLRAFVASTAQGVVYGTGTWHHPLICLETDIDFACVETQIGGGHPMDCEILELDPSNGYPRVSIPVF